MTSSLFLVQKHDPLMGTSSDSGSNVESLQEVGECQDLGEHLSDGSVDLSEMLSEQEAHPGEDPIVSFLVIEFGFQEMWNIFHLKPLLS